MGLGAVAGAVGIAQGVQGMFASGQQQRIAAAQAQANQKAAEASAAIRNVEINSKRDYAQYTSDLNAMTRQLQFMQSDMGLKAQATLDNMNTQAQFGQLNLQKLGNEAGLLQTNAEADKMAVAAKQQAIGQKVEAASQSANVQAQLGNAALQTQAVGKHGEARRAMLQSMQAATGQAPGRTTDTVVNKDLEGDIVGILSQSLSQQGVSEQDIRQLIYTQDIAEISKTLGINASEMLRSAAKRGYDLSETSYNAKVLDATYENSLAAHGRNTAQAQLSMSNLYDTNADAINNIFAEYGFQQQSNAVASQLGSQKAAINAQLASAQSQGPGIFDYLGMGLKAASSFGLFGGSSNSMTPPSQQSNYSIFSGGGYNMQPFSGNANSLDISSSPQFGFSSGNLF